MAVTKLELVASMDDGREIAVVADQRDFAKWEIQPEAAAGAAYVTRVRFLAWSAAHRKGDYKGSFVEFNQVDCVQVEAPGDAEESDSLDPGRSAASAEH